MIIKIIKVEIIDVPTENEKAALNYARKYAENRCKNNEFVTDVKIIKKKRGK